MKFFVRFVRTLAWRAGVGFRGPESQPARGNPCPGIQPLSCSRRAEQAQAFGRVVRKRLGRHRTCHRAVHPEVGRQAAEARDALRPGGEVLAAHVRADLAAHHVAARVVRQLRGMRDHVLVRGEDVVRIRTEIELEMRFPEIVGDAQKFGAQLGGRGGRVAARKASTDSNPNAATLSRGGVRSRARFSATVARLHPTSYRLPPTASAACPPTARRAQSAPARRARGRFGNRCRRDTKSN